MSRKVIITDIDGVLIRLPFPEYFSLKYGKPVGENQHWEHDEAFGVPIEESKEVWKHIWKESFKGHPYPGAEKFVGSLREAGYYVLGLSARKGDEARAASRRDCAGLGLDELNFVDRGKDKVKVVDELLEGREFVAMLEDKIANLIPIAQAFPATAHYLLNRDWNHSWDLSGLYKRVDSYRQILVALGIEQAAPVKTDVLQGQWESDSMLGEAGFCARR